jgi:hypothetical protein
MEIKVDSVVYRQDLYPRIKHDPETVQRYVLSIESLPPIEVNQHNELIDGWHRWTAHKTAGIETINVKVTETASEADFLELAIVRNSTHGFQLRPEDKKKMAKRIYVGADTKDRPQKKEELAKLLAVSRRTISEWLSDIDKTEREERNERIKSLWMQCRTQEEIAELVGCDRPVVDHFLRENADLQKCAKLSQSHATFAEPDFEPELYSVWTFAKKTNKVSHFGNSEQRIVDQLLYMYTKPFDVVVDPFAGGGSTIDVCLKRSRRYLVSDRKPIPARESEIRLHDAIIGGPLKPPRWEEVSLVYLDPPYWRQAQGQYSNDAEDLANMPLEQFTESMVGLINGYAKKMREGSRIALIIQPTQWNADDKQFTDHLMDISKKVKLKIETRIQAPYSSEQCNAQMVIWAKENRQCLVISREVIVWRV